MARLPRNPGAVFGYSELALAGNMTRREFQHLADADLLPPGRGIGPFKRVATIGAFMAAGLPLIVAGRIANALLVEFDELDGEAPSGLKIAAERRAANGEIDSIREPNDFEYHALIVRSEQRLLRKALESGYQTFIGGVLVISEDYWKHVARIRNSGEYYEGLVPAMESDVRIDICDRRHVYISPNGLLKRLSQSVEPESLRNLYIQKPGFVGWIDGWERGMEPRLRHVSEDIPLDHPAAIAAAVRLEHRAEQIYDNPVGKLTVNVSLAIRRAFDRIAEQRASRAKPKELE